MNKDIDDLRREHEKVENLEKSFRGNPTKVTIQHLFHEEFSGSNYTKYTLTDAKELTIKQIEESLENAAPTYKASAARLIKKINRTKNMESFLMALNEYLFA